MTSFTIVHHDGVVKVAIDDAGHAVIDVDNINDSGILVQAINRAARAGARTGVLFSNAVVNDQIGRMDIMRAETGTTWLGGVVTRMRDDGEYPQFRIDWDEFPSITE